MKRRMVFIAIPVMVLLVAGSLLFANQSWLVPRPLVTPTSTPTATPIVTETPSPEDNEPDVPVVAAITKAITQFQADHSGSFAVTYIDLTKPEIEVSVDGNESLITASTYKLFVAYSTILAVDSGEWSWDSYATEDTTMGDCFDLMIQVSDNTCAEALLDLLGMPHVQADAAAAGATETTFEPLDIHSTSNDEAEFLAKLAQNKLPISASGRARWLFDLKNNAYRDGIPAGIPNAVVADKVGFQDEMLRDAAIVYSPKGAFVLVIMASYASWEDIADLAAAIETAR